MFKKNRWLAAMTLAAFTVGIMQVKLYGGCNAADGQEVQLSHKFFDKDDKAQQSSNFTVNEVVKIKFYGGIDGKEELASETIDTSKLGSFSYDETGEWTWADGKGDCTLTGITYDVKKYKLTWTDSNVYSKKKVQQADGTYRFEWDLDGAPATLSTRVLATMNNRLAKYGHAMLRTYTVTDGNGVGVDGVKATEDVTPLEGSPLSDTGNQTTKNGGKFGDSLAFQHNKSSFKGSYSQKVSLDGEEYNTFKIEYSATGGISITEQ